MLWWVINCFTIQNILWELSIVEKHQIIKSESLKIIFKSNLTLCESVQNKLYIWLHSLAKPCSIYPNCCLVLFEVRDCKSFHCYLPALSQVQVDQKPTYKARYTESNGKENGVELWTYKHRENVPWQNINGLCSKITNRQTGPHKTAKLL